MTIKTLLLALSLLIPCNSWAADWYIDNTATGTNAGTSWANAWTDLADVSGPASGDTVYISGGPSGTSQTYEVLINPSYPGEWLNVINGVTYKIGQDSLHNGTAIFDGNGTNYWLVQGWENVTISGDANDGLRHFKVTNMTAAGNGANWDGVHIEYIDFSSIDNGIDFNPATGIEVNNCYFYGRGAALDHVSYASLTGATWDVSSFHHNLVYVPFSSANNGNGADGIQWNGNGYSIYNNTFIGYSTTYTGGQHQDGWHATGPGSYIKIYNNTFTNLVNYAIFAEPVSGGYTNLRVYNNIVIATQNVDQAIALSGTDAKPCTNCIMVNNTADGDFNFPFTFRNGDVVDPGHPNTFINCEFYNNVSINGGNNIVDTAITAADNVAITSANAPTNFVSWTAGSALNDLHLKSTASSLVGVGTVLSSYFTTDKDGVERGAAWDIGAYEYVPTGTQVYGIRSTSGTVWGPGQN